MCGIRGKYEMVEVHEIRGNQRLVDQIERGNHSETIAVSRMAYLGNLLAPIEIGQLLVLKVLLAGSPQPMTETPVYLGTGLYHPLR